MRPRSSDERGFALLAVLWVCVGLAALSLGVSLAAQSATAAARNRIHLTEAAWRSEDCVERASAVINEALLRRAPSTGLDGSVWRRLPERLASAPLLGAVGCEVTLVAAGTTLDVNTVDEPMLHRVLQNLSVARPRADSLVAALLDWRDADTLARPHGAEAADYRRMGRLPPRNGPLADVRELALVRGFDSLEGLTRVFGTEPGRICLNHAPLPVIAALPGIPHEVLVRIEGARAAGHEIRDLDSFVGGLSEPAQRELHASYFALREHATTEPDAWILLSLGRAPASDVVMATELRLVRAGARAAVTRRRRWSL